MAPRRGSDTSCSLRSGCRRRLRARRSIPMAVSEDAIAGLDGDEWGVQRIVRLRWREE